MGDHSNSNYAQVRFLPNGPTELNLRGNRFFNTMERGPVSRASFFTYRFNQKLRLPAGLKYQPVASNNNVNNNNASLSFTGTGTISPGGSDKVWVSLS